ncbi:MAG: hypothetical protein JXR56_04380, partial [Candidatus Cloacimonetes bacterium]|nr:hypothetical protein [Candidatus Cloacimonadota bacterium]
IEYSYTFKDLGLKQVKFEIIMKDTPESIIVNNLETVVVRVRDAKEPVLVITDVVNWETKFVNDALRNNSRLETTIIQAKNRQLYSGSKLLKDNLNAIDYSLLVLINNGYLQLNSKDIEAITDKLMSGKGILLIGMPVFGLDLITPMSIANIGRTFEGTFSYGSQMSEFRSFDFLKNEVENIPPVSYKYYKFNSGSTPLSHFNNKEVSPAIALKKSGKGSFLHLGMLNLWKWQLWSSSNGYRNFIVSLCNWLSNSTEDRVAFYSDRSGYKQGDIIKLFLKAYDEKMELIRDLQPEVTILNAKGKKQFQDFMEFDGNSYRIEASGIPVGEFTASVKDIDDNIYSEFKFLVIESGLEDANIGINNENLKYIASISGGKELTEQTISSLELEKVKPESGTRNIEIPLYRKRWLLVLFLLSFSIELWIRRRKGLL